MSLLEPVDEIFIRVPDSLSARSWSDLSGRRVGYRHHARRAGPGEDRRARRGTGDGPVRYAVELRAMTSVPAPSGASSPANEPMPSHLADQVKKEHTARTAEPPVTGRAGGRSRPPARRWRAVGQGARVLPTADGAASRDGYGAPAACPQQPNAPGTGSGPPLVRISRTAAPGPATRATAGRRRSTAAIAGDPPHVVRAEPGLGRVLAGQQAHAERPRLTLASRRARTREHVRVVVQHGQVVLTAVTRTGRAKAAGPFRIVGAPGERPDLALLDQIVEPAAAPAPGPPAGREVQLVKVVQSYRAGSARRPARCAPGLGTIRLAVCRVRSSNVLPPLGGPPRGPGRRPAPGRAPVRCARRRRRGRVEEVTPRSRARRRPASLVVVHLAPAQRLRTRPERTADRPSSPCPAR